MKFILLIIEERNWHFRFMSFNIIAIKFCHFSFVSVCCCFYFIMMNLKSVSIQCLSSPTQPKVIFNKASTENLCVLSFCRQHSYLLLLSITFQFSSRRCNFTFMLKCIILHSYFLILEWIKSCIDNESHSIIVDETPD